MATSSSSYGGVDNNFNKTSNIEIFTDPSLTDPQNGGRIVEEREDKDLSRSLKQRHIQMIALAGAIVSEPVDTKSQNLTIQRALDYS
jgi:amino acid permease